MIFLCVLENFGSCAYQFALWVELNPWAKNNEVGCSVLVGVSIFMFYFVENLMYWLFGFKYWVTSVEIQQIQEEQKTQSGRAVAAENIKKKRFCTETKYKVLSAFGGLVNLGICLWMCIERAQLTYFTLSSQETPEKKKYDFFDLEQAINGLLALSALFLADALRRLRKVLGNRKRIQINKRIMGLHIAVLFISAFISIWCLIT